MEWIIHLDTDELLHPGGTQDYSVLELLAKVPSEVDAVVFLNYVSYILSLNYFACITSTTLLYR